MLYKRVGLIFICALFWEFLSNKHEIEIFPPSVFSRNNIWYFQFNPLWAQKERQKNAISANSFKAPTHKFEYIWLKISALDFFSFECDCWGVYCDLFRCGCSLSVVFFPAANCWIQLQSFANKTSDRSTLLKKPSCPHTHSQVLLKNLATEIKTGIVGNNKEIHQSEDFYRFGKLYALEKYKLWLSEQNL